MLCALAALSSAGKRGKLEGNVLYVTEQNMSVAFEDLPAVLLLVQLGSDRDSRFRTRADFLAAATALGSRCFFALMDGDRNSKYVRAIGQKEAKAYVFYRYGEMVGRYTGSASTEAITAFVMSKTGIPFVTFDDYSVAQDFIESHEGAVVLYLDQTGGPLFDKYTRFAGGMRDNYSFGLCPDPGIARELGVTVIPSLILYRRVDHARIVYNDDLNQASVTDQNRWLLYNMRPRFEPFRVDNQRQYWTGAPILLFFTPVAEEALAEANPVIVKLALQYSNELKVLTVDAVSGNRFMTSLGFGRYADPAAAILVYDRAGKLTKYLHNEEDPFTTEDISAWIEDFLDKKLKPNVRSAALPSPNDGPVVEITAETFQKDVIDSDENILVLYYEEWDRLYQEFMVGFADLASEFKNASITELRFVKFEVAKNDFVSGPDPKKTPCLYLFPAKLKDSKPIAYVGRLTKDGVAGFIYNELGLGKPRDL
jgi:protein disulfide-isomerase A1